MGIRIVDGATGSVIEGSENSSTLASATRAIVGTEQSSAAASTYFDGRWHSVLVATLSTGITALELVSDDTQGRDHPRPMYAKRLWRSEHVGFGTPAIVKLANDRWAAVVGSSGTDSSALSVIDLGTGTVIRRIDVVEDHSSWNRLSSPAVADLDADGKADYAYAGDLRGNLYRFDIASRDPANWSASFQGKPLFKARSASDNAQAILVKPELSPGFQGSGVVVLFAAGATLSAPGGFPEAPASIYAIVDEGNPVSDRSRLQARTLVQGGSWKERPIRTSLALRSSSSGSTSGWYFDLQDDAALEEETERIISEPLLRDGTLFIQTAVIPNDVCEPVKSWIMSIPIQRASRLEAMPLWAGSISNDSELVGVGVLSSPVAELRKPVLMDSFHPGKSCNRYMYIASPEAKPIAVPLPCRPDGRETWRQLR